MGELVSTRRPPHSGVSTWGSGRNFCQIGLREKFPIELTIYSVFWRIFSTLGVPKYVCGWGLGPRTAFPVAGMNGARYSPQNLIPALGLQSYISVLQTLQLWGWFLLVGEWGEGLTPLSHILFGWIRERSQLIFLKLQNVQTPLIFTARCTLVQSAVLSSHVVCLSVRLSVRLSVTLVDCDHIGWNTSEIISPLVSLGCLLSQTQTSWVYSKGNTRKFWPKVTHPLLIWASERFDRKLQPNGYR